jgi:hypothetical protein
MPLALAAANTSRIELGDFRCRGVRAQSDVHGGSDS